MIGGRDRMELPPRCNVPQRELLSLVSHVNRAFDEQEGAYRVFVFVRDGKGNGATANILFLVQR